MTYEIKYYEQTRGDGTVYEDEYYHIRSLKIEDSNELSERAKNILFDKLGFSRLHGSIGDLATLSKDEIMKVPGLGHKTLREIETLCKKAGIKLSS